MKKHLGTEFIPERNKCGYFRFSFFFVVTNFVFYLICVNCYPPHLLPPPAQNVAF